MLEGWIQVLSSLFPSYVNLPMATSQVNTLQFSRYEPISSLSIPTGYLIFSFPVCVLMMQTRKS